MDSLDWFYGPDIPAVSDAEYFAQVDVQEVNLLNRRPVRESAVEDALVDRVFDHYRPHGFPYATATQAQIQEEFAQLQRTPSCLQPDGTITQNMLGLTTANSFHPEMLAVRCRSFRTPLEVFESDELLRRAIRHRIRYGDNLKPWGLRKSIFSLSRTQRVSNFRPAAAKAIYDHFHPGLVLDFSAGWGGRLLGAMASDIPYVGIDPHSLAVAGNRQMHRVIEQVTGRSYTVTLVQACAEDVLGRGLYRPDLIFTSPPYFDAEKYSDEPTQSYLRYPQQDQWFTEFLGVCLQGSYADLAPNGHLVLNVNPDMAAESREWASKVGFRELPAWQLLLSQHQFNKGSRGLYRSEPVLVFQKGG